MYKAAGISLIVAKMKKAFAFEGAQQIPDIIWDTIHFGKIPTVWEVSTIISTYQGKGVTLKPVNCQGLRLLDHGVKV